MWCRMLSSSGVRVGVRPCRINPLTRTAQPRPTVGPGANLRAGPCRLPIGVKTRTVETAGITRDTASDWMKQKAWNLTELFRCPEKPLLFNDA